MRTFLRGHVVFIVVALIILMGVGIFFIQRDTDPHWITHTVDQGAVRNIISVSGTIDAVNTAELGFPLAGVLESLGAQLGDHVKKDHVLATLIHDDLKADYQNAQAELHIAEADRDELMRGMRDEARDVSETTAQIAGEDLTRITREQEELVTSAYWKLLSTDLVAKPKLLSNNDTPPIISGTYFCEEGAYIITTYASRAESGYSYTLSGLESGGFTAYTGSPGPLGTCGLKIQFDEDASYGNSEWSVEIPNTQGASYVANFNAYSLARARKENAIQEAEQNLTLAEQNYALDVADPRTESLTRANARVSKAQSQLQAVSAQIADHSIRAPFDGTITAIDPLPGEAIGTTPIITLVSQDDFIITALIPEIDITKLALGQKAEVEFDAREHERHQATIALISPLATEFDGVSYFEVKLTLDTPADWLRSGLNADIDIIIDTRENVTRIPKRYLEGVEGAYTVRIPHDETATVPISVSVLFIGNDGFVEIQGLNVGQTIVAP